MLVFTLRRCVVCERIPHGTCARCSGPACRRCDDCAGCRRLICPRCDTGPTPEFACPGGRSAHPHIEVDDDLAGDDGDVD